MAITLVFHGTSLIARKKKQQQANAEVKYRMEKSYSSWIILHKKNIVENLYAKMQ